jgi:hypothetical protein
MACDHVIVFPIRHRGDPTHGDSRWSRSAFRWREGAWLRDHVGLTDADLIKISKKRRGGFP